MSLEAANLKAVAESARELLVSQAKPLHSLLCLWLSIFL